MSFLRAAVLLMATTLVSESALAQASVVPAAPKAMQTVRVQLPSGALGVDANGLPNSYSERDTRIVMASNTITVSLLVLPNNGFQLMPSPPVDLPIGQFPEGRYEVEVTKRSASGAFLGPAGSVAFDVAARNQSDPLRDNTDIWWNPEESGWGLNIVQHPSGVIFATWLVYGPDNKPIWYVMPGGSWTSPGEYRGSIFRTTGSFFGSAFDPTNVTLTLVGSATFGFSPIHYDQASVVFTIDGITMHKPLRRQDF